MQGACHIDTHIIFTKDNYFENNPYKVMQSCASASTINFSPWAYFFKLYIHNNYLLQGIAYHQQGFHQNLIFASLGSVK